MITLIFLMVYFGIGVGITMTIYKEGVKDNEGAAILTICLWPLILIASFVNQFLNATISKDIEQPLEVSNNLYLLSIFEHGEARPVYVGTKEQVNTKGHEMIKQEPSMTLSIKITGGNITLLQGGE